MEESDYNYVYQIDYEYQKFSRAEDERENNYYLGCAFA